MKKRMALLCLAVALALTAAACTGAPEPEPTSATVTTAAPKLDVLRSILSQAAPISSEATVTTEAGDVTLTSVFSWSLATGKVTYSRQRLAEISLEAPGEMIVTETGEIAAAASPAEGVSLASLSLAPLSFTASDFAGGEQDFVFSADVEAGAVTAVFGQALAGATDVTLEITVEGGRVTVVTVCYVLHGADVVSVTHFAY